MLPPGLGSKDVLPVKFTVNGEEPYVTLDVSLATGG